MSDQALQVKDEKPNVSNVSQSPGDFKLKPKLNAFEMLMNSSLKSSPDGTSSMTKRRPTRRKGVDHLKLDVETKPALGNSYEAKSNSTPLKQTHVARNRSRSPSPDIVAVSSSSSSAQNSDAEDNIADGIIGMKVRSPNTSRCSIEEN